MSSDAQVIQTKPVGHHGQGLPEPSDVDARHLLWLGGAALLLLSGAIFGLGAIYWREVPVKTMPPLQTFPQPRVETDDSAELQQLLERQRQELSGYRWANKQHTLLQIPIERAMQLIAQKGTQAYDPIASSPGALASPQAGAERAVTPSSAPQGQQPSGQQAGTKTDNAP